MNKENDHLKIGVREWAVEEVHRIWEHLGNIEDIIEAATKLENYVTREITDLEGRKQMLKSASWEKD